MEMKKNKWKQELIFVKRDENGVLIGVSEQTPEDYCEEVEESRYRIIGD